MTDNYEIIFQASSNCERTLKKEPLTEKEEDLIINKAVMIYETGRAPGVHYIGPMFKMKYNIDSTLYIVKLNVKKRALISVDADEIFDQLIITIWGIAKLGNYEKVFKNIGESMYQKYLNSGEEVSLDE